MTRLMRLRLLYIIVARFYESISLKLCGTTTFQALTEQEPGFKHMIDEGPNNTGYSADLTGPVKPGIGKGGVAMKPEQLEMWPAATDNGPRRPGRISPFERPLSPMGFRGSAKAGKTILFWNLFDKWFVR